MPFKEIKTGKDKGKMKSPGGRIMTKAQVKAYYATSKLGKKKKKKPMKTNRRKKY